MKTVPKHAGPGLRVPLLARMLVLLIPATLVPLIVFGAISTRRGLGAVQRGAENNLQLVASLAASRLDQLFADTRRLESIIAATASVVELCSAPPARRQESLARVDRWLKAALSDEPDLGLAYVADAQGICIVSTAPNMVGRDYRASREYMRLALAGEENISELAIGVTTREPGVFFAGPVRRADGAIVGAVVVKLKGEVIDQICRDVSVQIAEGFAAIVDANEVFISHPVSKHLYHSTGALSPEALARIDPAQYGVEHIESAGAEEIAQAVRQKKSRGYLTGVGPDGLPRVVGYARMRLRPWTVAVVQPRAVFDRPMIELAATQKWWIAGIGLLAVVGASWISYSVLRPIGSLRAAALQATGGDWSARAAVHGNDELSDLARAFNTMMPAIEERARMQDELRLADEVQRRTQAQADELRAQQERLLAAEERTRRILESASEGIFGVDTEGRITFVNPSACAMLGFSAEELIGRPSHRTIHHHHADGSEYPVEQCPMYRAYKRGEASRIDHEYLWRKDGKGVPVEYGVTPIVKDGAILGGVISFTDITERKRAEVELKAAMARAEEATKAKSAFLANMSHEIRTPMNGVIGMTELALDTDLTAEQRDYLNTVKSSADALLSLINDILDFSKIEAGRIELDPIEFLLRDAISDTLNPLGLRASTKGVELAYEVHPEVPDVLIGDVYRLRQVLVNLVGNAIKFTAKGEVVVTVRLAERSEESVLLEVLVRDTGIGIAPEVAARLFRPFEQAEASTTRKFGGTGLGLAISRQLVELMGGQIRIESRPGAGSTFIFTVRLKVGTARSSVSAEDAARVFEGKAALVVDDNETNRRILATMFGHWGLRTIEAASGSAALAALDRSSNAGQPISLIITDLHMPEMDGFDLAVAIRSRAAFNMLPILLLSSSAGNGDQERCDKLGIAARMLKPVKQSLLLDNMVRVLAGASRIDRKATPASWPAGKAVAPGSLCVLLAEDNPVNQKFAIRLLENAGHEVAVAANGREAVEMCSSRAFDLVLMDVQMPEVDGLEATREIRGKEAVSGKNVPIIAMTANAMAGDREVCMQAGMNGYVAKPVRKDALFAEIGRVLAEAGKGDGHGTGV